MRRAAWVLTLLVIASATSSIVVSSARGPGGPVIHHPHSDAVSPGWSARAQDAITKSEYVVSRQAQTLLPGIGATLQAPNRAQGLRTYFTPTGIRVIPRIDQSPHWTWGLDLTAYGFDEALAPGSVVAPVAMGNRVEYRRGDLVEWYVNDARGLEQGFTFTHPPAASAGSSGQAGNTLVVDLRVWGSLFPATGSLNSSGTIDFSSPSGSPILRYTHLDATDATGRRLTARMTLGAAAGTNPDVVRIIADATGAVYPVTIDPLALSADWTAESDQASAWYGYSVNTAGDVNGDGYSDVIVGAYRFDNGETNEGRAFAYYGSAAGLGTTPDWTAENDLIGAWFGHSVSSAGDVNGDGYADVIVGAPNPDHGTTIGLAYVYYGSATGLSPTPNWTAQGDQPVDWFGRRVQRAGDVNGDGYGDVIIGVPHYDSDRVDVGKAVAYYGSANGLSLTPDWIAIGTQVLALFGRDAKGAGDVNGDGYDDVIVGAHQYDHGQKNEGRAYVYAGSASGLHTTPLWMAESNQPGALFGRSVNTAGDVNGDGYADIIVGAPQYDDGQTNEGEAFVYYGSPTGPSATADWTAQADQADAWFGRSVASAGDINADGYSDVIIGAPNFDTNQTDGGKVFVYYGSTTGLDTAPDWTTQMNQDHAWFGRSVATAGDVNGDGLADLIVGAPTFDDPEKDEGAAFVFYAPLQGPSNG